MHWCGCEPLNEIGNETPSLVILVDLHCLGLVWRTRPDRGRADVMAQVGQAQYSGLLLCRKIGVAGLNGSPGESHGGSVRLVGSVRHEDKGA